MADNETVDYQPPKPSPELKKLNFLVGKWELTGAMKETQFGPAAELSGQHSWEWFNDYFLVHRWNQAIGEGVEYIGWEEERGSFFSHYFDNNGPYDEGGSTYEGEMRGKSYVICGPARITYTPSDDGKTIKFTSEGSKDMAHHGLDAPDSAWFEMMEGTFTKIDT